MNAKMKGALLFVPVLILAGLSLLHEYNRSTGTVWTVPIGGYDPRDLLRGHYLQFRYEWNFAGAGAQGCRGNECALCTDDPSGFNPPVRLVPLATAPQACTSFIAGSTSDRFGLEEGFYIRGSADNLTRYYVPESEAQRLQRLLFSADDAPEFSVMLRVTDSGTAFIETMYADGVPLEAWLQMNAGE